MDNSTEELWKEYLKTKDPIIKNNLIVHYIYLVKNIAKKIYYNLCRNVEYDDLIGYGMLGLIDAIDKFEGDKGAKFDTYAFYRIRGYIIDNIRYNDFLSSAIRKKINKIEIAYNELKSKLGDSVNLVDAMKRAGIKTTSINKIAFYINMSKIYSIDEIQSKESNFKENILKNTTTPEDILISKEFKKKLIDAINNLPEKERKIIILRYFHNKKVKEIHKIMGISYQYVVNLHSRALKILYSYYGRN